MMYPNNFQLYKNDDNEGDEKMSIQQFVWVSQRKPYDNTYSHIRLYTRGNLR